MKYTGITIRGNILSYEKLEKIQLGEAGFQSATDFGFDKSVNLRDEIGTAWSESKMLWSLFQKKIDSFAEKESGTSETRKLWMVPFLMQLGYDPESVKAREIGGQSFAISHQDSKLQGFPVLIMGLKDELDKKPGGTRLRISPHALMQEYLNKTENIYGLVSNGTQLRLLRDSYRLAKLSFIEFDLEKIFEEDLYFEFALLFRLLHSSRMPQSTDQAEKSPIEIYHQDSLDSGARIRDQLRYKVKEAMEFLANGFISEHSNDEFTSAIRDKKVNPQQFYKFLLRIMYRIIFLSTIEERDLVFPSKVVKDPDFQDYLRKKSIYAKFYSIERLRKLASSKVYINPSKHDLWKSLITTFKLLEPVGQGEKLGILPLGGDLFSSGGLQIDGFNLEELNCQNNTILSIIENLTTFTDDTGSRVRVNYRDLDVEELGSIYEALLELHPYFNIEAAKPIFGFSEGSQRKLTGSYYTRHDLVAQLIKTALYPVLDDRLAKAKSTQEKEEAILSIKVCDPSAGSGHFLIAAAKALGFELAKIRSGEENPGESWVLNATRDVISQCIHGVDKNPDAVELCRISLWLTGHSNGKPLTFIDHKIKCGDSLVGVDSLERLQKGIPDGAFKPVTSDDRATANKIKKRNNDFLKRKQYSLFLTSQVQDHQQRFAEKYRELNQLKIESPQDYANAKSFYQKTHIDPVWQKDHTASNLFTWAFFQPYEKEARESDLVHSEFLFQYLNSGGSINAKLEALANSRATEHHFFHWFLEFPDVFEKGGFDAILGNPPWERVNLNDKEFFSTRNSKISDIPKSSDRNKAIEELSISNPSLFWDYQNAVINAEREIKYFKIQELYKYGNSGLLNTYPLFTERVINTLCNSGQSGLVIPSGFFTDDTLSPLFSNCIDNRWISRIYDFENSNRIFPDIHRQTRFSLVTFSKLKKHEYLIAKFYCREPLELNTETNEIHIGASDIDRFNPNNKVCPSFRTQYEYDLNRKLYQFGVLRNDLDTRSKSRIHRMINMSTDSKLLSNDKKPKHLPVYESKLIYQYDHRFGSFEGQSKNDIAKGNTTKPSSHEKFSSSFRITPRYFASRTVLVEKNEGWDWKHQWYMAYRDIAASTNERTSISAIIPPSVNSNSIYLVFDPSVIDIVLFHGLMNSIVFDFVVRSKVNLHLPPVTLKQTPCIRSSQLESEHLQFLIPRILELDYTSWDLKGYADSVWDEAGSLLQQNIVNQFEKSKRTVGSNDWNIPDWKDEIPEVSFSKDSGIPFTPFVWNDDRRDKLKAELDAYYALLFGLSRDELRYLFDPKDLFGKDFIGDTFPVLKNKELKKYGEYRTRRLILEAYDRLRPDWDMEAHLAKLKEVWEKYQEDLIEEKKLVKKTIKLKPIKTKTAKKVEQPALFDTSKFEAMRKFELNEGIYSIRDSANIIGLPYDKARRWFLKLSEAKYEGLDNPKTTDIEQRRISFHGLVELVVIGTLLENGFNTRAIFKARKDLAERTQKLYPFATNNVRDHLKVAGKSLIFEFPGGPLTLDGTGQYNLELIREFFRDIIFDTSGVAQRLMPEKGKGKIVIDPAIGGGKPALKDRDGIQIDTIMRFYHGPDSVDDLVNNYGITKEEIEAAVAYTS